MPVIYSCAAVAGIVFLLWSMISKIRHGGACCGEHAESVRKLRAGDRDPAHYPYRYLAEIEGMVCGNCARTVENCFLEKEGISASVDLGFRKAKIMSKQPLTRGDVVMLLRDTSYTVMEFQEEIR